MRILLLGSGLIGRAIARDLAREGEFDVTVADRDEKQLRRLPRWKNLSTRMVDLSKVANIRKLVKQADLVIDALPGFLGYRAFRTVIESGKNVADIAFFPEDPFDLDELAREKEVVAVMDCGVAPGLSNILVADADRELDETERAEILVGGLPVVREWPYEYKIVFSPVDVIEEYTRPARYLENGQLVVRPALSDPDLVNFPGIGTLEAFNTDGLRTLLTTLPIPHMKEKTLRYPGHIEKMRILRESGFFDKKPIKIDGHSIRPLDFTARLLFPLWELKEGEEDLTVMRVTVEGKKEGQHWRIQYDLFDRYDRGQQVTSMARTTGYTAAMVARMVAYEKYRRIGVSAPEFIGQKESCVQYLLEGLAQRKVRVEKKVVPVEQAASGEFIARQ